MKKFIEIALLLSLFIALAEYIGGSDFFYKIADFIDKIADKSTLTSASYIFPHYIANFTRSIAFIFDTIHVYNFEIFTSGKYEYGNGLVYTLSQANAIKLNVLCTIFPSLVLFGFLVKILFFGFRTRARKAKA